MKFIFSPTLKQRALLKIVNLLWKGEEIPHDVSYSIANSPVYSQGDPIWQSIEKRVYEKVDELSVPSALKKQIGNLVIPVGVEIYSWWKQHFQLLLGNFPLEEPLEFIWTPQGTLDRRRTAETLVRNENINIRHRYLWACLYCLEWEIRILWNKIDKQDSFVLANELTYHVVVAHWTLQMDETLSWLPLDMFFRSDFITKFRTCSSNLFVFEELCYRSGIFEYESFENQGHLLPPDGIKNITKSFEHSETVQFFWHKLTPQEKQEFSLRFSLQQCIHPPVDMVFFIFSQFDEVNQTRVLRESGREILKSVLLWPRQEFFIEIVKQAFDILMNDNTLIYLFDMCMCCIQRGMGFYTELMVEFWLQCPESCKRYLALNLGDGDFFHTMCKLEDNRIVYLISNFIINDEKEGIFHLHGLETCKRLALHYEWELFKDIVMEHLTSTGSVMKFRKRFESHLQLTTNADIVLYPQVVVLKDPSGFAEPIPDFVTPIQATRLVFDFILKAMNRNRGESEDEILKHLCICKP